MFLNRRALLAGTLSFVAARASGHTLQLPDFLPRPTVNGAGLNQVSIDIPARFNLPLGPAVWVAEDGDDKDAGTFGAPWASLRTAFDRPDVTIVLCKPGRYPAQLAINGTVKTLVAPFGDAVLFGKNRDGYIANEGGTLGIGAGITLSGTTILARPSLGIAPTTILRGCRIMSPPANGLTSNGGVSFASNVYIERSQYDGFNYSHDGKPNFGIEHNCHVTDAGDPSALGWNNPDGSERANFNGSSSHGCSIIRYGGLYEKSLGPDVVDTWDDTATGQLSLNYGVLTRSSKRGIGFHFFGGIGAPTALLDTCLSEGQSTDLLADPGAWIQMRNSTLEKVVSMPTSRVDNVNPDSRDHKE